MKTIRDLSCSCRNQVSRFEQSDTATSAQQVENRDDMRMTTEGEGPATSTLATVALIGFAIGATAVGAMAIGALAIGKLELRRGRIGKLAIAELTIDRLIIKDQ